MPVFAMADTSVVGDTPGEEVSSTGGVAKIDDKTYNTLNEAVEAATAENGATITLLKNTTEDVTVSSNKKIILNLNGNTLTNVNNNTITIEKGAELTVTGNGTVDNVTHEKSAIYNKGTATLENGTFYRSAEAGQNANDNGGNSYYTVLNHGTMTVKSGVTVNNSGKYSSLFENGYYDYTKPQDGIEHPELTIKGGTFTGGINTIKNDDNATLTIEDGTFRNYTQSALQNHHIATINGGTFDGANVYAVLNCGVCGSSNVNENHDKHETTITGGKFNGAISQTVGKITILGGTFSSDVSSYCAENYVAKNNGNNTYTVRPLKGVAVAQIGENYYKSLTDAYAEANENTEIVLLKDCTIDKCIKIEKSITLDLGGKVLTSKSSGFDVYRNFTIKNGTLNTATWGVWTQNKDVAFTLESDATINADCDTKLTNAPGVIVVQGAVVNIRGTVTAKHNFAVSGNGTDGWGDVVINIADKANISTTEDAPALYFPNMTSLNIIGGTIIGGTGVYIKSGDVNISGGNITGNGPRVSYKFYGNGANSTGDALVVEKCNYPGGAPKITITGGTFKSVNANAIGSYVGNGETDPLKGFISGGSYSSKPTDYLKEEYIDKFNSSTKLYDVTKNVAGSEVYAEPTVGGTASPTAEELKKFGIKDNDAVSVAEAAEKVEAGPTQLVKSADDISSAINDDTAKIGNYKEKAKDEVPIPEKIEVRAYLKVEPRSYDKKNNYTLDITPMYDVVVIGKKDNNYAEKRVDSGTLNVTNETNITVQLPADFVNNTNTLYVQHKGHEYNADVAENNEIYTASFKNPDGFSEFTISKTTQAVAKIGDKKYTSLQDAVDAVENGQTITVTKDTESASVSGDKSFTIEKGTDVPDVTLTAASGYNLTNDGKGNYTVSPRHSSSGSGSSTTTYTVTVGSISNGTVTSSHKSAASGATVTLTVKPADGYAVEAVTAKDAKGNAVKVTEKDGKYTFAMPASNVTVSASFVKKGEQPAAKLFDDVAQGAYYYNAVKWAVDKGVTNGKTSNLFGSDDTCTRAQIVTFLWRAAGSPAASASVSFTDVKDSDYYAKAVAWAVEKGITNGTGDGKFSSDDTCTRAQCAAFLYRAAGSPEVTDAAAFSDVAADAYYAKAVAWAEKNGITNGLGNGKFGSDNSCTRAQIITFLYRTYQGK